tara:strand:- start:1330 stop:1536 length:207 start_codon:yes stop_codon:yes gene_type:complete
MTTSYVDQIDLFNNDLQNLIYRYKSEYDLHDETLIGCIEASKLAVMDSLTIDFGSEIDLDDEEDDEDK